MLLSHGCGPGSFLSGVRGGLIGVGPTVSVPWLCAVVCFDVPCCAVLCFAMLRRAVPRYATLRPALPCRAEPCRAVSCPAVAWRVAPCSAAPRCVLLCCAVSWGALPCCAARQRAVLRCAVLRRVLPCFAVPWCRRWLDWWLRCVGRGLRLCVWLVAVGRCLAWCGSLGQCCGGLCVPFGPVVPAASAWLPSHGPCDLVLCPLGVPVPRGAAGSMRWGGVVLSALLGPLPSSPSASVSTPSLVSWRCPLPPPLSVPLRLCGGACTGRWLGSSPGG